MDFNRTRTRVGEHDHSGAWRFLKEDVGADIALVQEAAPPPAFADRSVFRSGGIDERRPWSSAVTIIGDVESFEEVTKANGVWRGRPLGESEIAAYLPGTVAVARIQLREGVGVTAISMYGLIRNGYASTTVHHLLSDLEPLLDDPRYNDNIVLGGDLNIGTWWSGADKKSAKRDGSVLDRLSAFGLFDCIDAKLEREGRLPDCRCELETCRHVRTQRHSQHPDIPYQTDYVFASNNLRDRLRGAQVWPDQDRIWPYSDHLPLVADLEL